MSWQWISMCNIHTINILHFFILKHNSVKSVREMSNACILIINTVDKLCCVSRQHCCNTGNPRVFPLNYWGHSIHSNWTKLLISWSDGWAHKQGKLLAGLRTLLVKLIYANNLHIETHLVHKRAQTKAHAAQQGTSSVDTNDDRGNK